MQRLFSTFANGWPGAAILIQRFLVGSILVHHGVLQVAEGSRGLSVISETIGTAAGLFLLLGLWTPIAGALALAVQAGGIVTGNQEPLLAVITGTLSATIAMIGPGAWSLDARIFGRKHIEIQSPLTKSSRVARH